MSHTAAAERHAVGDALLLFSSWASLLRPPLFCAAGSPGGRSIAGGEGHGGRGRVWAAIAFVLLGDAHGDIGDDHDGAGTIVYQVAGGGPAGQRLLEGIGGARADDEQLDLFRLQVLAQLGFPLSLRSMRWRG